jgi:hypothetical protein
MTLSGMFCIGMMTGAIVSVIILKWMGEFE